MNQSASPLLQNLDVEIDQQSHRVARKPQIGQQLSLVDGRQAINRLDLHNRSIFYQQAQAVAASSWFPR